MIVFYGIYKYNLPTFHRLHVREKISKQGTDAMMKNLSFIVGHLENQMEEKTSTTIK